MRIVGGDYKGRVLTGFKGTDVRPTSDQTRESLFNILQFRIKGKSFLDLFCGTGAVGIEAYSRGAARVVLNDLSRDSLKVAKENLSKLKIENIEVKNCEATALLSGINEKFDFIFIDAPYASDVGEKAVFAAVNCLNDGGEIIYENEKPLKSVPFGAYVSDERKYGRARLTFVKKSADGKIDAIDG